MEKSSFERIRVLVILVLLTITWQPCRASHIVGGEFSYKYVGELPDSGVSQYNVSLTIYEDCLNGSPLAIMQDNPAFLAIYENDGLDGPGLWDVPILLDTNLYYTSSQTVPTNFSNQCVTNIPPTCLLRKTFNRTYNLPHNSKGYIIVYQRCCRNASINNVQDPGNTGSTFFCTIPAWPTINNSAVFNNFPPQIICLDNPLFYDNSASDADSDSLSYAFCVSLQCCAGSGSVKPYPPPPDQLPTLYYDSISYLGGYTSSQPMNGYPQITINPTTGMITGTPNLEQRYLVTVCCTEWRHGVKITTDKREFQFVVTPCTKKVVADIPQYSTDPNTYIVDCKDFSVFFVNTSTGGFSYHWNFGIPGLSTDTSANFEPTFTYPDTGTFSVELVVNPGSTCPDSISRLVKIYPKFVADFTDTGLFCSGDTIGFIDLSSATIKPIDYWKWNFGDGDSSLLENPKHSYAVGGTYNVVLISENIKDCIDTVLKQVLVEKFRPFAGNDTIIVKGEIVNFDATGGIQYFWSPPTNLNDTVGYDPQGSYPESGIYKYLVKVKSEFGCWGLDSISVTVVDQAEFFVPSAFSPNGDNLNDYFKPIAVGFKSINYFSVFNRWGQRVYLGNSFEEGWDGTFNNQKCDVGVYFWEISFVDRYGKTGFLKGDVTLVR